MKAGMSPRVSVILTAYNAERYLPEAMDSLLAQTLQDFEIIAVDDCSTDGTQGILAGYAARDDRVRVIRNDSNVGAYASANRALELAAAPLIARMDADDISRPDRLAKQVGFLDAHPDHMLVASSYESIDENGAVRYRKLKGAADPLVRWVFRFRMAVEHPSMCFRAAFPDGTPVRYRDDLRVAADYELCLRLIAAGKACVLPETLISYRTHDANITSNNRTVQRENGYAFARDFHMSTMPASTIEGWDSVSKSYFLGEAATSNSIRIGAVAMRQMIRIETGDQKEQSRQLKKLTAGLLTDAFLVRGKAIRHPATFAAFLWYCREYVLSLTARIIEEREFLFFRMRKITKNFSF
ncbi:glycosyltransferase family 2 protein [Oceanomicrobium pacificus]|uniref:Glycosyltransferase n=1 Tax=Oceanomicrobium pacificus TaxID=2692916 RepID=A0A6B0TJK1_9RHOB|nr:glycosyltransferase [Oceanomicrobium pacificus]MXU64660.1 glycosyltransferase [Oceanomicrobium pacificus]